MAFAVLSTTLISTFGAHCICICYVLAFVYTHKKSRRTYTHDRSVAASIKLFISLARPKRRQKQQHQRRQQNFKCFTELGLTSLSDLLVYSSTILHIYICSFLFTSNSPT